MAAKASDKDKGQVSCAPRQLRIQLTPSPPPFEDGDWGADPVASSHIRVSALGSCLSCKSGCSAPVLATTDVAAGKGQILAAIDDALSALAGRTRPRGHLPAAPRRKLAVLTCMDARLDPLRDLGLDVGDAHVIRNAGGRATDDALRSLLLSWQALGTRQVLVVHHTNCGVHVTSEGILRERLAEQAGTSLDGVDLHTFAEPAQAVGADIARIVNSPFAPEGLVVRGAIFDVDTGSVTLVPGDGPT